MFENYPEVHRKELERRIEDPHWKGLLDRKDGIEHLRKQTLRPPPTPVQQIAANRYLIDRNKQRVLDLIHDGETDEEVLLQALGDWKAALSGDDPFPIVFLGFVVTLDCTFMPRCLYCNQTWLPRNMTLDHWKALIEEATHPVPPYIYITGGEPLRLEAELWGDQGLIPFAAERGSPVNINTNAVLITPHAALRLVRVGTAKLHISVDCADAHVQAGLMQGDPDQAEALWDGIYNIQIAREVLGADHPIVHVNCVLTARNMFQLPGLLRRLLEVRKIRSDNLHGKITEDPMFYDFALHLIPVGGGENVLLRPTEEEWRRFYTETWQQTEEVWDEHQKALGIPPEERVSLRDHSPFINPLLRVDHQISPEEYFRKAAEGSYWQGALLDRCYVAPSQAYVLPDGSQHWCGAHAIRRPPPIGNVIGPSLRENIRSSIDSLDECPNDFCTGCAGATCMINQAARKNLRDEIRSILQAETVS